MREQKRMYLHIERMRDMVRQTQNSVVNPMKAILTVIAGFSIIFSVAVGSDDSDGVGSRRIEWQILTKQNFSSQIRLHPHILLMVTVPWSGESRSLMKDLAHAVTNTQEKFGFLKLMLMYKSNERMLADALGAREGLTFLYYHHSVSYRYQGRLHSQNILTSIYSIMSLLPVELPLVPLNSPEVLKAFLESTDKAVILLEFCGWTPRLLEKWKNNTIENNFGVQGGLFGTDFNGENNGPVISREKKDQKGMQNAKLSCGVENKASGIPFLGEFSLLNDSNPYLQTENTRQGVGLVCTAEDYRQFDSFFTKFIAVTREFFLPPERQRYGLVSDRSLLSFLGVEDSGPWFTMLYFAGCPGCSIIFKEVDDLKTFVQMHNPLVTELEDDGHDIEPALPGNKPSILLFMDRSSDSAETREKSRAVLDTFRRLVVTYQISHQVGEKISDLPEKVSAKDFRASRSTSKHPRLKFSPTNKKIEVKDRISITLDNRASDSQGSSLPEVLAYFLKQKKEAKLSLLAKELGFQLLSDDLDIKIEDTLPSEAEVQSNQHSPELPLDGIAKSSDYLENDQSYLESISSVERDELPKTTDIETSSQYNKEKTTYVATDTELLSVEPELYLANKEVATSKDVKKEEKSFSLVEKEQQQLDVQSFTGSFFFSDGGYQLLRALTGGSNIPSMVIVDPISQQHFVFPEDRVFSYSSLSEFIDEFLNGSLTPYQRSESVLVSHKEAMRPPFVNLDFHEVDSIPRVTALSFSNLVLGLSQSGAQNSGHAWEEDVLVLFCNGWCGFCQRMELVVREVYRALKSYLNILKQPRNVKLELGSAECMADNLKDDMLKLPLIFLMDCTLNECSSIFKSMGQIEVYPALMLFPAERKNALSYEGDMSVSDVIKFIADHGSHSHHLIGEEGILWSEVEKGGRNQDLSKNSSSNAVHEEALVAKDKYYKVVLKSMTPKKAVKYNSIRSHSSNDYETTSRVVTGSILVATEKLLSVHPFDKSTILIVNADHNTGFQGLIINKPISWDSLDELEVGLELLIEAPLFFGGPILKRGYPLVSLSRSVNENEYREILPGIYFLDQSATIHKIDGRQNFSDYWFFLGYSSWGWEQLYNEIAEGAWNLIDNDMVQLDWP